MLLLNAKTFSCDLLKVLKGDLKGRGNLIIMGFDR